LNQLNLLTTSSIFPKSQAVKQHDLIFAIPVLWNNIVACMCHGSQGLENVGLCKLQISLLDLDIAGLML